MLEVDGAVERRRPKWRRTPSRGRTRRRASRRSPRAGARSRSACATFLAATRLPHGVPAPRARRPGGARRADGARAASATPLLPHAVDVELVARRGRLPARPVASTIEPRKQWPDGCAHPGRPSGPSRAGCSRRTATAAGARRSRSRQASGRATTTSSSTRSSSSSRRWSPDPRPTWVTCVPSLRQPELVPSLAARLAARLGLPFHPVVTKVRETAPQAEMDNSAQQYAQRRRRVRGHGPGARRARCSSSTTSSTPAGR